MRDTEMGPKKINKKGCMSPALKSCYPKMEGVFDVTAPNSTAMQGAIIGPHTPGTQEEVTATKYGCKIAADPILSRDGRTVVISGDFVHLSFL